MNGFHYSSHVGKHGGRTQSINTDVRNIFYRKHAKAGKRLQSRMRLPLRSGAPGRRAFLRTGLPYPCCLTTEPEISIDSLLGLPNKNAGLV